MSTREGCLSSESVLRTSSDFELPLTTLRASGSFWSARAYPRHSEEMLMNEARTSGILRV